MAETSSTRPEGGWPICRTYLFKAETDEREAVARVVERLAALPTCRGSQMVDMHSHAFAFVDLEHPDGATEGNTEAIARLVQDAVRAEGEDAVIQFHEVG